MHLSILCLKATYFDSPIHISCPKELNNGAEEGEFREITEDIKVYNGEYLERPKAFYNNGVSKNRKIETNNGYKLEASMEHGVTTIGEDDT